MMQEPDLSKKPTAMKFLPFMGVISVFLSFSVFLYPFAPFPLAIGMVLYGRRSGLALIASCIFATFLIDLLTKSGMTLTGMYLICCVIAYASFEVIHRGWDPRSGLVKMGLIIFGGLTFLLGSYDVLSEKGLRPVISDIVKNHITLLKSQNEKLLTSQNEGTRELLSLLDQPDYIVNEVMHLGLAVMFIAIFFWLWAMLFLLLKNHRFYEEKWEYPYTEKTLLMFKVMEPVIWPLIGTLAVTYYLHAYVNPQIARIGLGVLYCFGIFYFFQGFGIYMDFLRFLKIRGFFRSIFVMMAILFANNILAGMGLFDMWVDFRRFFKPKKKKE